MGKETEISVPQRILESAYRCIARKGYASASMRDIAEDAGVALGQLNYYYKNKEGLYMAVIRALSRSYREDIRTILQQSGTARERLNRLVSGIKQTVHEKPELNRMLFDLISMSIWNPSFRELLSSLFDELSALVERYLFAGQSLIGKSGRFSAETRARSVVGSIFGTVMQYILNPRDDALLDSLNLIQI